MIFKLNILWYCIYIYKTALYLAVEKESNDIIKLLLTNKNHNINSRVEKYILIVFIKLIF